MDSPTLPFHVQLATDVPFAFDLQARALHLQTLVDQRARRGVRYPLVPFSTLAVCASLAGYSCVDALAVRARLRAQELVCLLGLKRLTMPHATTWSRVLAHA